MKFSALTPLLGLPALISCTATTDELQDADPPQSGYLPNHNINPSTLASYKLNWRVTFNANEFFYAKPLVYTPPGQTSETVIVASNQNIVRILDGRTGKLINSRTFDPPFLASDSQCGDIQSSIGITGTPYIDNATDIMYFFAKGYQNGASNGGVTKGRYKMYAVKLPGLADISGYPVVLDSVAPDNDAARHFLGGTALQRPGLVSIGDSVIAGFSSSCSNFNYTGMLMAVSKTKGRVNGLQAMVGDPGAPHPQALDINDQNSGKAGIWQSGMALAVDNNRVFFVTGTGKGAGDNAAGKPKSGSTYLSTVEQAVANYGIDPQSGKFKQLDWFEPWDYDSLNGGDRDFGAGGLTLLDPTTFNTPTVKRIAVAGGKIGKIYVMNADNLGGFMNGPGGKDAVLQIIDIGDSIFSGVASYPLDGGYIYVAGTGGPLLAFKFNPSGNSNVFTQVAKSSMVMAGKSVPVVTSNQNKPGTGAVWLADINNGLVAFNAVPVNGVLQPLPVPSTGRLSKFQRAVFGNNRVYAAGMNTVMGVGPV